MTVDKRYIFATLLCVVYYVSLSVLSLNDLYKIEFFDYFAIILYSLMMKFSERFFEVISGNVFGYYCNWKPTLISCFVCIYIISKAGLDFHFSPLIAFCVVFVLRIIAGALLWRRKCAHETQNNS
mgnify:CR=1 FL=1|tara:strand:- start:350 stop:724 length:375 start_codon:yes stop_codon:yes gene_type:complete